MVFTSSDSKQKTKQIKATFEHRLQQKYPKKHNHYALEDFFCFQSQTGSIIDWNKSRNILTSEDFILGLIQGLEQEIGSAAGVVTYNIGKEWGKRDADFFQQWLYSEFEYDKPLKKMNLNYILEAWWWPFTAQGWGNWEVDMSEQKNGFMFVNIFDSAVARTLGDVGKPVCHIYAGLLAGFFSKLVNKDLNAIEIQCYAMGETYCKFLVGKKDRVDAATFWLNEGALAKDVEKRLHHGEYLK